MDKPVEIDIKLIYEVCPDIPTRKTNCVCKKCGKQMQVWGEVTTVMWNDYLDGSGETINLCESCAKSVIKTIEQVTNTP